MIRGQQQKVQLLTARNESDIGKMHRSPLHGLWQENNRAGSPPKAIVIKPIDSVYQKMHCRNAHPKNEHIHQQQMQVRPQSHFLQAVTRGKTPDEKPTPNRKGLFQLELEKNKENLIPNCTPWHVIEGQQKEIKQWPMQKQSEETTNRAISVNRNRKNSMLVTFNPQPAPKGKSIRESDQSLLISSALDSVNKSSIEDLSFQAYLRPPC